MLPPPALTPPSGGGSVVVVVGAGVVVVVVVEVGGGSVVVVEGGGGSVVVVVVVAGGGGSVVVVAAVVVVVVIGGGCAQVNAMETIPLETSLVPSRSSTVIVSPRTSVIEVLTTAPASRSQSAITAVDVPLLRMKSLLGCSDALFVV